MESFADENKIVPFHIHTPFIENENLSEHMKSRVFLKLDTNQPSGSYKIRGIGYFCQKMVKEKKAKRFVTSSGGNAGIAVAYSGKKLGVPVTVVLPESTSHRVQHILHEQLGAEVILHGAAWDDANQYALKLLSTYENAEYVHPFDHPLLWHGHSSIIDEIYEDFYTNFLLSYTTGSSSSSSSTAKNDDNNKRIIPDLIVTVVGGGGLLSGICEGLEKYPDWKNIPIVAAETIGADSYYQSIMAGKLVTLDKISSEAKTLGAKRVCQKAFDCSKTHNIRTVIVRDDDAKDAVLRFVDDARQLVELSCGAGLACLYKKVDVVTEILEKTVNKPPVIIVIVCGGNAISFDLLCDYKRTLSSYN